MDRRHCSIGRLVAAAVILLSLPVPSFSLVPQPPPIMMSSFFSRLLFKIEGYVASRKVNSDRTPPGSEGSPECYAVGPDSDYEYASTAPLVDHSVWNAVLSKYVSPGKVDDVTTNVVDYVALSKDENVEVYRKVLESVQLSELEEKPNELLALYINAYNCLCIGHVTRYLRDSGDGELPKSVTDTVPADSDKKEIWDVEAGIVGGEVLSLNDIEHKILRSRWDEPRVHASIVCASASCPNLRAEAFVPQRLNAQMDDQVRTWLDDPTKGLKVMQENDDGVAKWTLSRIFLWFEGDFAGEGGPVAWIRKSRGIEDGGSESAVADVEKDYFKYNWNLNNGASSATE